MPGKKITNVTISNIQLKHAGGGNPMYAKRALDELDKIPEFPDHYPEFSMFKELPAWGIYIRHAEQLIFSDISLTAEKKDYRLPIVADDVHNARFSSMHIKQPRQQKTTMHTYKCSGITVLQK